MQIIVNPAAAGGRLGRQWPRLERRLHDLGIRLPTVWTEAPAHATALAATAVRDGHEVVVAAGGDGTICEVLEGLQQAGGGTLAILPLGTGNDAARGTIVAQVMPNVTNTAIPIVRRFQDDLRKYGEKGMRPTIFQLEAYVTTQLTLDAMRRAGPGLNRARLTLALDSLKKYDLGGFAVDFSATKHTGSDFVDISIVGRDCRLIF